MLDKKNLKSNKHYGIRLRCTIQSSGRLGFTEQTIKTLEITKDTAFLIYTDDKDKDLLYFVKSTPENEDAFPARQSGKYFYLNAALLFDELGIDYRTNLVSFDIRHMMQMDEEMEGATYMLRKREEPRTQTEGGDEERELEDDND